MFTKRGYIVVPKSKADEETLMSAVLEAGGDDIRDDDDNWEVLSPPETFQTVLEAVKAYPPREKIMAAETAVRSRARCRMRLDFIVAPFRSCGVLLCPTARIVQRQRSKTSAIAYGGRMTGKLSENVKKVLYVTRSRDCSAGRSRRARGVAYSVRQ